MYQITIKGTARVSLEPDGVVTSDILEECNGIDIQDGIKPE